MNVKSYMNCRILYVSYLGFLFMITATLELDHSYVVAKSDLVFVQLNLKSEIVGANMH